MKKDSKVNRGIAIALVVSILAVGMTVVLYSRGSNLVKRYEVVGAEYPKLAKNPDGKKYLFGLGYDKDQEKWFENYEKLKGTYVEELHTFVENTVDTLMPYSENDNVLYSPSNLYMTMSLLAEIAGGNTRQQILDAMFVDNIEQVRDNAKMLWEANYWDDGVTCSILGNSMWLNGEMQYNEDTLDNIKSNYYASVFSGDVKDKKYEKAMKKWISEQTKGMLDNYAEELEMSDCANLVSTIYFNGKWAEEFSEEDTTEDVFHANAGDITCKFMHNKEEHTVVCGDKYLAVKLNYKGRGSMVVILPDEGFSVKDIMSDKSYLELFEILSRDRNGNLSEAEYNNRIATKTVNLSMPKFDVSQSNDIREELMKIGITDAFDANKADFSELTSDTQVYLDQALQAVRVTTDEKGTEAAAYTFIGLKNGASMPAEEIEFVVDRPFIFAMLDDEVNINFMGIVNQP